MSGTLTLPLNGVYFDQIKAGTKTEEYRLVTPYWSKRLVGRSYLSVVFTKGYPKADDRERRIKRIWRGYTVKTITHPHFGPDPVEVFAIFVGPRFELRPVYDGAAMRPPVIEGESSRDSQTTTSQPKGTKTDGR